MELATQRKGALILGAIGIGLTLLFHYMVFFTVSTEATLGVVQRIFYVHVPSAWVAFLAFGIVALSGAVYLWIGEERLDQIGRAAAEGGLVFTTIVLLTGPLWARLSWGTWWTWEPRLTLTLLLWFIYVGYFMVRNATASPEQGRRYAAVVGIVGALNIPLIHVSVIWFRSLHPEPVVLNAAEGPSLPADMLGTLMVALAAWTALFFALFSLRYAVIKLEAREEERSGSSVSSQGLAGTMKTIVMLIVAILALAGPAWAQAPEASPLEMRHFWHVFAAYTIAWVFIGGWLFTIVRRLRRVEERLR